MGYPLLILGVAVWSGAHLFKRLAPERRAALGERGKGLLALIILFGLLGMIVGYRAADPVVYWYPPAFLRHLNNLLVLLGFYLFVASFFRTAVTRVIRHPQLSAVKAWAVAHLLVVPTLPGLIVFGGLLAWAVAEVILINRAQPRPAPPPRARPWREVMAGVTALVAFAGAGWIHGWLGPWPFG